MRLLVTGGAGFIGSALVRLAMARGYQVTVLDALTYAGCEANLDPVRDAPGFRFVRADIRDPALTARVVAEAAPDAILHLAAESHVDRSIDGPAAFVETNVTGTFNMLEAAMQTWQARGRPDGFRFLHVSTDEVFGALGPNGRFDETTAYAPRSPYAATKAASDHLVRAWHETYGLPVLMSNCSNNYGPYQFPEKLIPVTILNALAGRPLPVYGDGSQVRDWIHVEDHAAALLLILERGRIGETYLVGAEEERTNIELVRLLCAELDRLSPRDDGRQHADAITFVDDRPGHDARYAIDPRKIRDELGWRPTMSLVEGLSRTARWYLDNGEWWRALQAREGVGQRLGLGR